ncbi:MAG: high-affinity branched-chain amino acid ABC transporter permease LivM [Deltaproteobacteria bacterium]|nr:high-affinity branched-chain amino acid ABC transporter permease LivM [Deltaproteobacteria bacterium]
MIQEFKSKGKKYLIGLVWIFLLLWPLLGINADGTLTFAKAFSVWLYILCASIIVIIFYIIHKKGLTLKLIKPLSSARNKIYGYTISMPKPLLFSIIGVIAFLFPFFTERYAQDVAINVLIYICLGLGLNIVVGMAGLLDLGYIAFYGVGAYAYALLNTFYGISFWISLPIAAVFAGIAGCIVGYPTLRMRGDYLAIVTLGFGEIIRIIFNNWMQLTNGPNGILGIKPPSVLVPNFTNGFSLEYLYLKKLHYLYYVALILVIFTIIVVARLSASRIGRAWEAIREDETAAEMMGVNTFSLKLLAYAAGAILGGIAGAFFAARMRFVSPESFTFIESAMVLSMVVLGGMGSIPGIILGVIALIALPEVFREFELYRMLAFGASMTLMMLFRPKGIIPSKRMGVRSEEKEE